MNGCIVLKDDTPCRRLPPPDNVMLYRPIIVKPPNKKTQRVLEPFESHGLFGFL